MVDSSPPSLFSRLKRSLTGMTQRSVTGQIASLPIHAFGKLPIYKDFISCGLTDDASRELRDWLSEGYSKRWAAMEGYREVKIPPYSFLFQLPHSRRLVAGTLWGSGDQGGLRRFPFLLFLVLPAGQGSAPMCALEYLQLFEQKAIEIRSAFGPHGTLSDFYQKYRGAKIDLPLMMSEEVEEALPARLEETTIGEFARSLFGAAAPTRWPAFLASMVENAQSDGAAAVRFPLSGLLPAAVQMQFWIQWLALQAPKVEAPIGFLYQNGGDGRAVLMFRNLRAEDILLLHPDSRDYDHAEEAAPYPQEDTEDEDDETETGVRRASTTIQPAEAAARPAATSTPAPAVTLAAAPTAAAPTEAAATTGVEPKAGAAEAEATLVPAAVPSAGEADPMEVTEEIMVASLTVPAAPKTIPAPAETVTSPAETVPPPPEVPSQFSASLASLLAAGTERRSS